MLPKAPCVEVCEVRADQHDAGLADAELRTGDVENALPRIAPAEAGDLVFVGIADQKLDHVSDVGVGNAGDAAGAGLRIGRNVVIGERKDLVGMRHRQAALVQRVEGVSGAFVDETAIDVKQRLVFLLSDDVTVPDLVEERFHFVCCSNAYCFAASLVREVS